MTSPFFTIIIPVKAINDYVRETVSHVLHLADKDWELIIVPNEESPSEWSDARIQVIPSGRVGPGLKRDMAATMAKGEVLVFLDDDSYPKPDLLTVARPTFSDANVAAIGGPAITPPEDSFWQKVSGTVFLSRFSGGAPERYVPVGSVRETDDWPSVNLMVRRSDFLSINGFDSQYWPGEDTKLCLKLLKKGKKIIYNPALIVWHHRRAGLRAHLKQVGAYGLHRGFFAKRYPETSFRLWYFAPAMFFVFSIFSLVGFGVGMPRELTLAVCGLWALYGAALMLAFADFLRHVSPLIALHAVGYTFFTHLVYGFQFIRGFVFTRELVSTLR